eukprot:4455470-Prymnesium_polylepis.1
MATVHGLDAGHVRLACEAVRNPLVLKAAVARLDAMLQRAAAEAPMAEPSEAIESSSATAAVPV